MGAGSSVEVPGGGTEGYHVLRVRNSLPFFLLYTANFYRFFFYQNKNKTA